MESLRVWEHELNLIFSENEISSENIICSQTSNFVSKIRIVQILMIYVFFSPQVVWRELTHTVVVIVVVCHESKGGRLLRRKTHFLQMAGVLLPPQTINSSSIYLHLRNFDLSLKGREISLEPTSMVTPNDRRHSESWNFTNTYTECTRQVFGGVWNRMRALRSTARRHNH